MNRRMPYFTLGFILAITPLLPAQTLQGRIGMPRISGHSEPDIRGISQGYAFASLTNQATGTHFLLGDRQGEPSGFFEWDFPGGEWNVMALHPFQPWRPIVTGTAHRPRGRDRMELRPGIDYACTFNVLSDWGEEPWVWGAVFEQSFIALGHSITGVVFKLAGVHGEEPEVMVSIRDAASGEAIGEARTVRARPIDDLSVSWLSGQVPTVPGGAYVLRIEGAEGPLPMGVFVRRDYGWGYPHGAIRVDEMERKMDAYAIIYSDSDGLRISCDTLVTAPTVPTWFGDDFGQTFTATGRALAGLAFQAKAQGPVTEATVTVHFDSPGGRIVGPPKLAPFVQMDDGTLLAGTAYGPEEVRLRRGMTYYVRIEPASGESFVCLTGSDFSGGHAYVSGQAIRARNLALRVLEYAEETELFPTPTPPPRLPDPNEVVLPLINPSFETGDLTGWNSAAGTPNFDGVFTAEWQEAHFDPEARKAHEGEYFAGIIANQREAKHLIYQQVEWPFGAGQGLCHVRAYIAGASFPAEARDRNPITVRICVSPHGGVDATYVPWSQPYVAGEGWTLIDAPPIRPTRDLITVYLLIEGGSSRATNMLKVDDISLVIDATRNR